MQWQQEQLRTPCQRFALAHRPPNLRRSRQKSEDVSLVLFRKQHLQRLSHLYLQRLRRVGQMPDRKLKERSRGSHYRAVAQVFGNRRGLQCGRHHDNPQLRPSPLQPLQKRQSKIALQVPLMKLVEHHGSHALQLRVGEHSPCQHAFGHKAQPCARAHSFFKANLVANAPTHFFAHLKGNTARSQPGGNASWLQHHYFALHRFQHRRRNASRFARTRRRLDDEVRMAF